MTPLERLQARIAAIRANGLGRLHIPRKKKVPPTGGGETRSRAPAACPAKPPDASGPANATPAPGAVVLRGSCKAVSAFSGRKCQLPAHGDERAHHDGRQAFARLAAPEQTSFEEREQLEKYLVRSGSHLEAANG